MLELCNNPRQKSTSVVILYCTIGLKVRDFSAVKALGLWHDSASTNQKVSIIFKWASVKVHQLTV